MSFKFQNRDRRTGQVTLEYFILFAAVTVAVVVGFQAFHTDIRNALEGFFNAAATKMAN